MPPLKLGLIGFSGSANNFHLPYLLPACRRKEEEEEEEEEDLLELYAILQRRSPTDPDPGPFGHCTARYPGAKHYETADEFFADQAIELVVITTTHRSHFPLAQQALEAGKHVLIEKPFTCTSRDADTLIALAKEKGLLLTCYQNRRWDSDFLSLQRVLREGWLGELVDVGVRFDIDGAGWVEGWGKGKYEEGSGDGMLFGLGSHTFDQVLRVMGGEKPERVMGWLRVLRKGGEGSDVEDGFVVVLEYSGGTMVRVETSVVDVGAAGGKWVVRGREGSWVKELGDKQEWEFGRGKGVEDEGFGVDEEGEGEWGVLSTREKRVEGQVWNERRQAWVGRVKSERGYWRGLYENVAKAVRGEEELVVKAEESRDGIRLIELARESARTGRTVPWS